MKAFALAALFMCYAAFGLAQGQQRPTEATGQRVRRRLTFHQMRYELRAGEPAKISAPRETLDFMRTARTSTVTTNGMQTRGFAVGPSMRGDEILLAASLTMKAGEYAVTVSAVSESGEERTAVANVTVDALPVVPSGGSTPPVVLLNGWQFSVFPPSSCPISTTGSAETFGSLAMQLAAPAVYFFDNCVEQSVNGSSIEELGVTLGQFLNMVQYVGGALVPQVDLVSHSMGGLIVRSYLAGLQPNDSLSPVLNPRVRKFIEIATPNFGSFLAANYSALVPNGSQSAEMLPGSVFLWSLATWNQRGDDLRGVDALAIIGNAGYWKSSIIAPQLSNASDGVVSLTSASHNFARDPSRTRILSYCHIDSASPAGQNIDCLGKGGIANVDQAPETGAIILSFLGNTSAWQSIGYANQTQYGGGYFALENAAGTQYTSFISVSLGAQSFQSGATNTIFYSEFASGTGTFQATSTAGQTSTCGPFSVTGGYFSIFRCKFSPVISSVGPFLPNVAGWVVTAGGSITINGVGFGQQCSGCQVLAYPGPIALQPSLWSDSAITAFLPSTYNGITEVVVKAASGSDAITFMAAPPASPPTISLGNAQLQFTYTVGGAVPGAQSVQITNTGGGTLSWSATSSAPWLSVTPTSGTAPSTLTVAVLPSGLAAGPYTGTVTISAPSAASRNVTVALTVNPAAPSAPAIAVTASSLRFAYTVGGAVPAGQSTQLTNSGGGALNWSAIAGTPWLSVTPNSGTAPSTLTVSVQPAGLAAGTYTSTVTISALGAASLNISVSLTVSASPSGPTPVIASIVNAASFVAGMVPGGLATMFGKGLSPIVGVEIPGAAISYKGVSVKVQGRQVPLFAIANVNGQEQINFQVPFELGAPATARVEVSNNGSVGSVDNVQLLRVQPGIFEYTSPGTSTKYAAALHADYSVLGPNNPAARGEAVSVFLTGMGITLPNLQTGQPGPSNPPAVTYIQPAVQVGGAVAQVLFSGYAPGFLGLYQINIIVPGSAPVGSAVGLVVSADGVSSQTTNIAVQ